MNNKIIVNASALRSGGALTILRQFIAEVKEDQFEYLVFIDESVSLPHQGKNIQIVRVNTQSFLRRFVWDALGLNNWIKKNKILPLAAISLQNTNFRLSVSCPNYIYYHQSIPIYEHKWHFYKSEERTLWFYKYIYPFFVKLFINTRTEIFVQLEFIRIGFAKRFSFDINKIHVVFPNVDICLTGQSAGIQIDNDAVNLFYPASNFIYKNHQVLFDSLCLIDKKLKRSVTLYLTVGKEELGMELEFENVQIVFLGELTHDEVFWLYQQVDLLVFPSYIETLGLPLIEASFHGLPVLVSDLEYSREVLHGYPGVTFVQYNNAEQWAQRIFDVTWYKNKKFDSFTRLKMNNWKDFFDIIKKPLEYV